MRRNFVASVAVAAVGALKVSDADYMQFVARYGRNISTTAEMAERKARFAERDAFIAETNARRGASFQVGHNSFSDMTESEVARILNRVPAEDSTLPNKREREVKLNAHPTSVDWRNTSGRNFVSPVKDQMTCAASWAFATVGAAEAKFAIDNAAGKMDEAWVGTVKDGFLTFSEQQLLDCDTEPSKCASGESLSSLGCTGGHVCSAHGYLADTAYLTEDSQYPYNGTDGNNGNMCGYEESSSTYLKLAGYERHTTTDVSEIKSLVAQQPITTSIAAASPVFQSYSRGIFDDDSCGETGLDHNVLIVGYGSDATSGGEYWILKNSWGSEWGEAGFMRLRILTEDDGSLVSSVATGGFCKVLQGANYAPSFSERADHVKAPHARLQTALPDPSCTVLAWNSDTAIENQSWIAGSTAVDPPKLTYTFPAAEITGNDGALPDPADVTKEECAANDHQTYAFLDLDSALDGIVSIPTATAPTMEVATDDRSKANTYTLSIIGKYNVAQIGDAQTLDLTIVDPCVAPATIAAGADAPTTGTYMLYSTALVVVFPPIAVTLTDNSIDATTCSGYVYQMPDPAGLEDAATFVAETRTLTISYNTANDITAQDYVFTLTPLNSASEAFSDPTTGGPATSTYTLTLEHNPCESSELTVTAPAEALAQATYTLGATAMVLTWEAFDATSSPPGTTCAILYEATTAQTALTDAAAVNVSNEDRTVTVSTNVAELISETDAVYTYTVAVKSPSGVAIADVTTTVTFTIIANSLCEPPATVTPSTVTPVSFTVGSSTTDVAIAWTDWTYATDPAGSACLLAYAAGTIPEAIEDAVTCTASTKSCTLATGSVTEAMVGTHTVAITGTTPLSVAIPNKSTTLSLTIVTQCTIITSATAPTTAAQSFVTDGTTNTYTLPLWTAEIGALDCASKLNYDWTIPAALTSAVTTSADSRVFSFTSSDNALASTAVYTISVSATTSLGAAITLGSPTATFTLGLTGQVSAEEQATAAVNQISTVVAATAATAITGVAATSTASAATASTGSASNFDSAGSGDATGADSFESGDSTTGDATDSSAGADGDDSGAGNDEETAGGASFDFSLDNFDNEYGDLGL